MLWVRISLRRGVLNTLCDKDCQWLAAGRWFSNGTPVSSTNKAYRHDIAEILLKVALNTITLPIPQKAYILFVLIVFAVLWIFILHCTLLIVWCIYLPCFIPFKSVTLFLDKKCKSFLFFLFIYFACEIIFLHDCRVSTYIYCQHSAYDGVDLYNGW